VDAAVELASQGHKVHVFTAHHDKTRCFEETVAGVSQCIFVGLIALLFVPSIILTLILAEMSNVSVHEVQNQICKKD